MKAARFSSMHMWSASAAWAFTLGHNQLGVVALAMTVILLTASMVAND